MVLEKSRYSPSRIHHSHTGSMIIWDNIRVIESEFGSPDIGGAAGQKGQGCPGRHLQVTAIHKASSDGRGDGGNGSGSGCGSGRGSSSGCGRDNGSSSGGGNSRVGDSDSGRGCLFWSVSLLGKRGQITSIRFRVLEHLFINALNIKHIKKQGKGKESNGHSLRIDR